MQFYPTLFTLTEQQKFNEISVHSRVFSLHLFREPPGVIQHAASATVCFRRRSKRRSRCQRRQSVDVRVRLRSQRSPRKLHLKGQRHR